jgi:hypothetical protein
LLDTYRSKRDDGFLAPVLLEAIGILAMKNPLAQAELTTILLRLQSTDDRYLLIKAAKVIGWIEGTVGHRESLPKLQELLKSDDLHVQAEVRQQLALVAFADALLATDQREFRERVAAARAAFERAYASEEHRPDAAIFIADGLMTGLHVDDAEAAHGQANMVVDKEALVVGTAVHNLAVHGGERLAINPLAPP